MLLTNPHVEDISKTSQSHLSNSLQAPILTSNPQFLFIISLCVESHKNYHRENAKKKIKNIYKHTMAMLYLIIIACVFSFSITGARENWDTSIHNAWIRQVLMNFLKVAGMHLVSYPAIYKWTPRRVCRSVTARCCVEFLRHHVIYFLSSDIQHKNFDALSIQLTSTQDCLP